jgi:DNA-binding response OmpR family regulator
MRLLLVEDNRRLAEYIGTGLRAGGFALDSVGTAADATSAIDAARYDAIVLDLGLPDVDGTVWLSELRKRNDDRPVLVLTARDSTEDAVKSLNLGADDYMRKPFEMDELVARVRALLRRPGAALGAILTEGNVSLDTCAREVKVGGSILDMGRRETSGLEFLMRRAGRVVPKAAMEEAIYDLGEELGSNAVEVLVHRLRKHLHGANADISIHTLRGVGYILSGKEP